MSAAPVPKRPRIGPHDYAVNPTKNSKDAIAIAKELIRELVNTHLNPYDGDLTCNLSFTSIMQVLEKVSRWDIDLQKYGINVIVRPGRLAIIDFYPRFKQLQLQIFDELKNALDHDHRRDKIDVEIEHGGESVTYSGYNIPRMPDGSDRMIYLYSADINKTKPEKRYKSRIVISLVNLKWLGQ